MPYFDNQLKLYLLLCFVNYVGWNKSEQNGCLGPGSSTIVVVLVIISGSYIPYFRTSMSIWMYDASVPINYSQTGGAPRSRAAAYSLKNKCPRYNAEESYLFLQV